MFDIIIEVYGEKAEKEKDLLLSSILDSGCEFLVTLERDPTLHPLCKLRFDPDHLEIRVRTKGTEIIK